MWFLQTQKYAKEVEEKKEQHEHYNILPLYAVGVKPAIMELPEVVQSNALVWLKLLVLTDNNVLLLNTTFHHDPYQLYLLYFLLSVN